MTSTGPLIVVSTNNRRGAELQGSALAKEMAARGTETHVVALGPSTTGTSLGLEVLGSNPLAVRTLRALRRTAAGRSVVIGYGSKTLPACALAMAGTGTPFIYSSIGDPTEWVRGRLHQYRTKLLFQRSSHVVALWPGSRSAIRTLYGVADEDSSVLPNARSIEDFRPANRDDRARCRVSLQIDADAPVVVFLGALSPEKCPETVAKVAAGLPDMVFVIVGDGPLRPAVEQQAQLCTGDVRVLGPIKDVAAILACADVIFAPSRTEGMPGSLIEAALMEVPSVATDVGAVAEVVGDGGIVLPYGSTPAEFSAAICTVLDNRVPLGRKARERAELLYTWDVVAPQWIDLIRRLQPESERP